MMTMVSSKGKKTIGFVVPEQYSHSGTEFRDAVDRLFEAIWEELSENKKAKIAEKYQKEIDILNWRCE